MGTKRHFASFTPAQHNRGLTNSVAAASWSSKTLWTLPSSWAVMRKSAGYQVCIVHSVAAVLGIAQVMQPHLALIDLGLPDGDGYERLASLQADRIPGTVPVWTI
jgi:hypothetical protein